MSPGICGCLPGAGVTSDGWLHGPARARATPPSSAQPPEPLDRYDAGSESPSPDALGRRSINGPRDRRSRRRDFKGSVSGSFDTRAQRMGLPGPARTRSWGISGWATPAREWSNSTTQDGWIGPTRRSPRRSVRGTCGTAASRGEFLIPGSDVAPAPDLRFLSGADDGIRTRDPHLGKVGAADPFTCPDMPRSAPGPRVCLLGATRRSSSIRGRPWDGCGTSAGPSAEELNPLPAGGSSGDGEPPGQGLRR